MAETTGFEPVVVFNDYNGLANRRFQPLSHVSTKSAFFILAAKQTLSSHVASNRLKFQRPGGLTHLTDTVKIATNAECL